MQQMTSESKEISFTDKCEKQKKKQIKTLKSQNQKKKKKVVKYFFWLGSERSDGKKKIDPLKYLSAISVQNLEVESSQYSSTVRMSDTS